ncbi:MAG: FtsQ-type POTRA domain-containing protein [Candidatus Hydrogenedentales bacterium]
MARLKSNTSRRKQDLAVSRRKRPHRRGRWLLRAFEAGLMLALLGVAGFYGYRYVRDNDGFQIRKVTVEGVQLLSQEEVAHASGVSANDNILLIDQEAVRARVEALPYVRTCAVSVVFPDTVQLIIEEREPAASVLVHSRAYEIDAEGFVLKEYAANELPRTPFITNVRDLEFIEVGKPIRESALHEALEVWSAYETQQERHGVPVAELAAFATNDIRMYSPELPYELRWGRGDYPRQAERLALFWDQVDKATVCDQYLDLRFGADLICK